MRTLKYLITVTVNYEYGPLSQEDLAALQNHLTPESMMVECGIDDHFFMESIAVKMVDDGVKTTQQWNG